MADKKRAPAKSKKPTKAKAPKNVEALAPDERDFEREEEQLETRAQEVEREEQQDDRASLESSHEPHEEEVPQQRHSEERPGPRTSASDEYTLQTYFDRGLKQFVVSVAEFPELKVTGTNRQMAISELSEKIEDHLYELKSRGQFVTEPIQARVYPERLDIAVSQSLYRKLDLLSRQEKLPIDKLVGEILATALGKRQEGQRGNQNRPPQHQHGGGGQHHGGHQNRHQHQQNRHHGGNQNRHQRGGNVRDMDSRENFMEYVRNLEKGGGSNWKKR